MNSYGSALGTKPWLYGLLCCYRQGSAGWISQLTRFHCFTADWNTNNLSENHTLTFNGTDRHETTENDR